MSANMAVKVKKTATLYILARDVWKKRYFEEKKRTTPLEEKANKLRNELDSLHRRIMSQLETQRERDDGRKLKDNKPSQQVLTKLSLFRLFILHKNR